MKKMFIVLFAVGVASTAFYACSPERNDQSLTSAGSGKPDQVNGPLIMSAGINSYDPPCTFAHGNNCIPGGYTCLLRFPPEPTAPDGLLKFYAPEQTGEGETGTQMAIEFLIPIEGLENGILGPEELDEPVIQLYDELVNQLGHSEISIINKKYYPVMDNPDYPNGYVVLDCNSVQ